MLLGCLPQRSAVRPACVVRPLRQRGVGCLCFLRCLPTCLVWPPPNCSRLREQQDLTVTGDILYNGRSLDQFVPERSASYISQVDLHYGEELVGARC